MKEKPSPADPSFVLEWKAWPVSRSSADGTFITTARSGHYIQEDEPGLVAWSIERVLDSTQPRR